VPLSPSPRLGSVPATNVVAGVDQPRRHSTRQRLAAGVEALGRHNVDGEFLCRLRPAAARGRLSNPLEGRYESLVLQELAMRGSRPGERRGGRQRGTKNKRTVERERASANAAAKIATVLGADAFEGDAHAFLMSVYKDAAQPSALRIDAAKAAIGYERPRLSSIDATIEGRLSLSELIDQSMTIPGRPVDVTPSPPQSSE